MIVAHESFYMKHNKLDTTFALNIKNADIDINPTKRWGFIHFYIDNNNTLQLNIERKILIPLFKLFPFGIF